MARSKADFLQSRSDLLDQLRRLTYQPIMRGSLVERRRRCGKSGCACATDDDRQHRGQFFTVSLDGSTQAVHVRPEDEAHLREALDAYARLWDILDQLTRLEIAEIKRGASERRRAKRKLRR